MTRLPIPDWTREGETWRVEGEPLAGVLPGGVCTSHSRRAGLYRVLYCHSESVAVLGSKAHPICERHLNEIGLWVEGGRVVGWVLRP
jgi:hypothetical protein